MLTDRPRLRIITICLTSIFLSFVLYGNTIGGEFVYDDTSFAGREELRDPRHLLKIWTEPILPHKPSSAGWRPLVTTTFSLNFILFGDSPVSFHIVTIVLNGTAAFLVYVFVKRISNNEKLSLLSALFFSFLPIHTGAVAFIKARDDILSTIFILLGWISFLKIATPNGKIALRHLLLSSFFSFLAMLCKEQAVFAPLFFFGLEIFKKTVLSLKKLFLISIPYLVLIGLYLVARIHVFGAQYAIGNTTVDYVSNPLRDASTWQTIWTACKIAFIYIGKTFIPINLSATYTYNKVPIVTNPLMSWQAILGFFMLASCIAFIFWKKTRGTFLSYALVIFLLCYIPISRFIFRDLGEIVEEHWMYLPTVGLSMVAAHVCYGLYQKKKTVFYIFFISIIALYGIVTIHRNRVWHNEYALFASMIKSAKDSVSGHAFLAMNYYADQKYADAEMEIDKASAIYSDHPPILNLKSRLLMLRSEFAAAETLLMRSIILKPYLPESHKLYARVLAKQGRYTESLDRVRYYLTFDPDDRELHYLMALNLYKLGMIEEARTYFDWSSTLSEQEKIESLERF